MVWLLQAAAFSVLMIVGINLIVDSGDEPAPMAGACIGLASLLVFQAIQRAANRND